jgi:hypothetical protein
MISVTVRHIISIKWQLVYGDDFHVRTLCDKWTEKWFSPAFPATRTFVTTAANSRLLRKGRDLSSHHLPQNMKLQMIETGHI